MLKMSDPESFLDHFNPPDDDGLDLLPPKFSIIDVSDILNL